MAKTILRTKLETLPILDWNHEQDALPLVFNIAIKYFEPILVYTAAIGLTTMTIFLSIIIKFDKSFLMTTIPMVGFMILAVFYVLVFDTFATIRDDSECVCGSRTCHRDYWRRFL